MITVLDDIAQQRGRRINIIDNHIDVPTIENISECRSAPRDDVGQPAAGGWWHVFELGLVKVPEKLRPFRPGCSPILPVYFRVDEIGRASSRERMWSAGGAVHSGREEDV